MRSVLLVGHLMLLLFPLGGVVLLRFYESVLVRRTESELLVQGVVVAAAYDVALAMEREAAGGGADSAYGLPLPVHRLVRQRQPFRPVVPRLDLSTDPIHPEAPPTRAPARPSDGAAIAAGKSLGTVLKQVQRSTLAGIRVVDWRGTVVASTRGELGRSLAHRLEVRRALAGEDVGLLRKRPPSRSGEATGALRRASGIRVFVGLPVVQNGRVVGAVVLSRTPPSVGQTLQRRRGLVVVSGLAVLALVLALSLLTAWTVTRPLGALSRQAARLAQGDREAARELAHPVTREVRDLSRAFVEMARTLDERSEYIRGFAASVSHELRTPLTGIRGALELLADHMEEMTPEERAGFLANLEADAARLERLVQGLLELARAEVARAGSELADPVAAARRVVERFAAQGFEITLRTPGEPAWEPEEPSESSVPSTLSVPSTPSTLSVPSTPSTLSVPSVPSVSSTPQALSTPQAPSAPLAPLAYSVPLVPMSAPFVETLLANLLENARQHGAPPVSLRVDRVCEVDRVDEANRAESGSRQEPSPGVLVEVTDAGPGVSEANLPRIFERFFTTARNQGGTGLGLAMVRILVEKHGGQVVCESRPGQTRFRVLLPGLPSSPGPRTT